MATTTSVKQNIFSNIGDFLRAWSWPAIFGTALAMFALQVIRDVDSHRQSVTTVAGQNPTCIYLEKSELGRGQHYMLCDNVITIKRVQEEKVSSNGAAEDALNAAGVPVSSIPAVKTK
jgi:hypothetical protein